MLSVRMSRWRSSRIRTSLPATNMTAWVCRRPTGDHGPGCVRLMRATFLTVFAEAPALPRAGEARSGG